MKHSENTFRGSGQLNLFCQYWLPPHKPAAVIVLVHGGGDHSSRYMNVVNYFVPREYAIYALDLRGHGRSPGQRGHINNWSEFREDLAAFIEFVRQKQPASPLFLYGHSMGGVIVLDYCIRNPKGIRGVISTSPAIGELGIPAILWSIARILDRIWPNAPLGTGLDITKLSRDSKVVQDTKTDPLYHRRGTPRFGMEIKKTVAWIHAHAHEFSLPLLILHGKCDEIASIEGSYRFIQNVACSDMVFREYDDCFHELHNDFNKEQLFAEIEKWCAQRLKTAKTKKG